MYDDDEAWVGTAWYVFFVLFLKLFDNIFVYFLFSISSCLRPPPKNKFEVSTLYNQRSKENTKLWREILYTRVITSMPIPVLPVPPEKPKRKGGRRKKKKEMC